MQQLKLAALDEEDLSVISAQVQDAVLKVGDIRYYPSDRYLVLVMNRFAWDGEGSGARASNERRRSALSFARAERPRAQNIRQDAKDAVLSLLAINFVAVEEPAGRIDLVFAGGGTLSFDVECIEAQLADLGAAWATENRPSHETD